MTQKMEKDSVLKRPDYWGGWRLSPSYMEFWKGRPNRLHDRISFSMTDQKWNIQRLEP